MLWPPKCPDLIPIKFVFLGYVKKIIYSVKIRELTHLRERIINATVTVTPDMLLNSWLEIDCRLDMCIATNGAHIENY